MAKQRNSKVYSVRVTHVELANICHFAESMQVPLDSIGKILKQLALAQVPDTFQDKISAETFLSVRHLLDKKPSQQNPFIIEREVKNG